MVIIGIESHFSTSIIITTDVKSQNHLSFVNGGKISKIENLSEKICRNKTSIIKFAK